MRKNTSVLFIVVLAASLCFSACELLGSDGIGLSGTVDYDLQGTWRTIEQTSSSYIGTLEIGFNSITISGFSGTGNTVPFYGYSKSPSSHQAYSEKGEETALGYEGILKISHRGDYQSVPFTYYWDGASLSSYEYFLEFTFGGRVQTLKKD